MHPLDGPVDPLLGEPLAEVVGVLVRLQVAQVDAVHPVELLVVEGRRARNDALERKALDQLMS